MPSEIYHKCGDSTEHGSFEARQKFPLFFCTFCCNSTRRPVSSGNGRDRVTVRCAKYDLRPDAREELEKTLDNTDISDVLLPLVWVDTVGWDDADLQGMVQTNL